MPDSMYLLFLLIAFVSGGLLYKCGVADGSKLSKGKEVKSPNVIKAVVDTVEEVKEDLAAKKEAKEAQEKYDKFLNVMSYKQGGKK